MKRQEVPTLLMALIKSADHASTTLGTHPHLEDSATGASVASLKSTWQDADRIRESFDK